MGQQHSDLVHLPHVHFRPECEVLEKTHDSHYGEIKIVRQVNSLENMILKETAFTSKQAFESEASILIKRLNTQHPNMIRILGFNFQDKHNFCSSYFRISLFIESADIVLSEELERRRIAGTSFSDLEILYIGDNLISGLAFLQSHGMAHGDVRPFNVFQKEKVYKLSDPILNPQKGWNALNLAIVKGVKTFLAPELLRQIPQNNFDVSCDEYRADVFSLGATLLSLATLMNSEDLYNYREGIFNLSLLQERLEIVRLTYSELVYELIRGMLQMDNRLRPDFFILANKLAPYQDMIHTNFLHPPTPRGPYSQSDFTFGGIKTETELGKKTEPEGMQRGDTEVVKEIIKDVPKKKEGEVVKKSLLPPKHRQPKNNNNVQADGDDLEARITAALQRSQATFKALKANDSSIAQNLQEISISYTPSNSYIEKHIEIETQKESVKSSTPLNLSRPFADNYLNYPQQVSYATGTYPYTPLYQVPNEPREIPKDIIQPSQIHSALNNIKIQNNDLPNGRTTAEERIVRSSIPQDAGTTGLSSNPYTTGLYSSNAYPANLQYYSQTGTQTTNHDLKSSSGLEKIEFISSNMYIAPTPTARYANTTNTYIPAANNGIDAARYSNISKGTESEQILKSYAFAPLNTNIGPEINANRGTTNVYYPYQASNYPIASYRDPGMDLGISKPSEGYFQTSRSVGIPQNQAIGGPVKNTFDFPSFSEQLNRVNLGEINNYGNRS